MKYLTVTDEAVVAKVRERIASLESEHLLFALQREEVEDIEGNEQTLEAIDKTLSALEARREKMINKLNNMEGDSHDDDSEGTD